eukprot:TRINITY_DN3068_c0_g1_i1.p1 TRINITY_DN3068_c0_g1~~TRINITY_DN3068_c0_g1_i1.p1  ORF type:complete len:109 (+),score=17.39 TRINITY_DN3068_c0_g1_i1:66-392(+)
MSESAAKKVAVGDKFELKKKDEATQDVLAMMGVMFGLMGLLLKYRIFIWQSVVCCVMSMVNSKSGDFDLKQMFSSLSIGVMGLIMALPPVGVWTVSQFQCGWSSSQTS